MSWLASFETFVADVEAAFPHVLTAAKSGIAFVKTVAPIVAVVAPQTAAAVTTVETVANAAEPVLSGLTAELGSQEDTANQ